MRFHHPQMCVFHSGGWKRLTELTVERKSSPRALREYSDANPQTSAIFYGLVEQVGVVFVDCEAGNKQNPNFAEIAIRDFLTLRQVEPGKSA